MYCGEDVTTLRRLGLRWCVSEGELDLGIRDVEVVMADVAR